MYNGQFLARGDVVIYDVTGKKGMHGWMHLNGRVGIVLSGPHSNHTKEYKDRWFVEWLFEETPKSTYPIEFLQKIGHIDLDVDSSAQEGEKR